MRAGVRRGPGGLRALLAALGAAAAALALGASAYNLAPEHAVLYQGPAGSFFGYAVLEHFYDNTRWVLVGAPKADSKYSTSVKSPGAVFKCRVHTNPDRRCTELDMVRGKSRGTSCGKTCKEDRDDEWMGVSLARQPKADGQVLVSCSTFSQLPRVQRGHRPKECTEAVISILGQRQLRDLVMESSGPWWLSRVLRRAHRLADHRLLKSSSVVPSVDRFQDGTGHKTCSFARRTGTAICPAMCFYSSRSSSCIGVCRAGCCEQSALTRTFSGVFAGPACNSDTPHPGPAKFWGILVLPALRGCLRGPELVVMGAPGSFYWAGTVKVLNLTDNMSFKLNDEAIMNRRYTYLGYAVTAGHFVQPSSTEVVGGAPQDEGIGKVYIFRADRRSGSLIKIFQASGKKMGSYFGSSLCAVDLNADGLSDLLVGAPMFSEIRDEGQVTVYINRGSGALEEQLVLDGDRVYNAHFGESIASLGDIDDDGFPDVAVGAPKENDFVGAVYIYHGDADGIVAQYSMKLSGQQINPMLRMFGQSISGGVDMDGNGYPDVTIGAFMSDHVVLLRARPVITVDVSIFLPASINITAPQCYDGQQSVNCLNVTACFRFRGKHVPGEIGEGLVLSQKSPFR
ncbi:integrin alpha-9-like [Petaurus breviceps papuanus]|uniref:integrin alpha-9-like n=1 Tax=Petaurus breviceps papuanus TaxID=3040969 RepID=UPI0036D9C815